MQYKSLNPVKDASYHITKNKGNSVEQVYKAIEEVNLKCIFHNIISIEETVFKKKETRTDIHTVNIVCKLTTDDIDNIKDISKLSQELNLVNENTPPSMAAGCIYLYIKNKNLNIHKKDISDVCKISEVTINKCYKKLEEYEELLIIPA